MGGRKRGSEGAILLIANHSLVPIRAGRAHALIRMADLGEGDGGAVVRPARVVVPEPGGIKDLLGLGDGRLESCKNACIFWRTKVMRSCSPSIPYPLGHLHFENSLTWTALSRDHCRMVCSDTCRDL